MHSYQSERAYITRTMRTYERPMSFFERTKWLAALIVMSGAALLSAFVMGA